jgi:membrane fusion protein (multidrug efflux system)
MKAQRRNLWIKSSLVAVFALAVGLSVHYWPVEADGKDNASAASAKPQQAAPAQPPVTVEAVTAQRGVLTQEVTAVGTVYSNESVQIRPEISGRVTEIAFRDGTPAKKGEVLFRLDDSVQQAELARAKASLQLAESNASRYTMLAKKGYSPEVRAEEASAELNLARANLQLAQANLDKTVIRAPFDGIAGIRRVSPGDMVSPTEVLVNYDQIHRVKIEFTVPERYLQKLSVGSDLAVMLDKQQDDSDEPMRKTARINALESRVDEASRSIRVQAAVDNENGRLYAGEFVKISLPLREEGEGQHIVLPDQAIVPLGSKNFLFLVEGGKAKRIEVETGRRSGSQVEITGGLEEGQTVVVAGQQKLRDNAPVAVKEPTVVTLSPMTEEREPTQTE